MSCVSRANPTKVLDCVKFSASMQFLVTPASFGRAVKWTTVISGSCKVSEFPEPDADFQGEAHRTAAPPREHMLYHSLHAP